MSATDLSGDGYRIEVVWLAREAIRTVLDHRRRALVFGWAPWALVVAADLAAAAIAGGGTVAGAVAAALLRAAALFVFGSVVALRWQRYLLLDEREPAPLVSAHCQGFIAAAWRLALAVLGAALVIVLGLELVPLPVAAPLAAVGGVALLAAAVRVEPGLSRPPRWGGRCRSGPRGTAWRATPCASSAASRWSRHPSRCCASWSIR